MLLGAHADGPDVGGVPSQLPEAAGEGAPPGGGVLLAHRGARRRVGRGRGGHESSGVDVAQNDLRRLGGGVDAGHEGHRHESPTAILRRRSGELGSASLKSAEGMGFEPMEALASHAFQACPFGRSGNPPRSRCHRAGTSEPRPRAAGPDPRGYRVRCQRPLRGVTAGSCATGACEPGQGRKAAALSSTARVPQTAWPSLPGAGAGAPMTLRLQSGDLGQRLA